MSNSGVRLSAKCVGDILVLCLGGDVRDPEHEEFLLNNISEAVGDHTKVVINLQFVVVLPSAVIGQLVTIHKKCKGTGLVLCCLTPGVNEQLLVTQLDKVFTVLGDQETALAHLQK